MATDFTLLPDVVPPDVAAWQESGSLESARGDVTV